MTGLNPLQAGALARLGRGLPADQQPAADSTPTSGADLAEPQPHDVQPRAAAVTRKTRVTEVAARPRDAHGPAAHPIGRERP